MKEAWISKAELASAFRVTVRAVEHFQALEGFPAPRREARSNLYPLGACVAWFVEYRISQRISDADEGETMDLTRERALLTRSQRAHRDLLTSAARGELVPVEDTKDFLLEMAAIYGSQLDSVGGRLASELAGITDPGEIRAVLFEECRRIRRATAERIEAYALALINGSEDTDEASGGTD